MGNVVSFDVLQEISNEVIEASGTKVDLPLHRVCKMSSLDNEHKVSKNLEEDDCQHKGSSAARGSQRTRAAQASHNFTSTTDSCVAHFLLD